MALPQQVIDRLSKEPPKTPGWSIGMLTFAAGMFFLVLLVYFGLSYGYEPYIDSQIAAVNTQIDTLAKSVSTDDQGKLITFYSEISNIKTALGNHVALSHFFSWLEKNTEANVYFARVTFSSGNQFALTGIGKTEADVNQQIAILETAPDVKTVNISTISVSDSTGLWQFSATLTINPGSSVLRAAATPQ